MIRQSSQFMIQMNLYCIPINSFFILLFIQLIIPKQKIFQRNIQSQQTLQMIIKNIHTHSFNTDSLFSNKQNGQQYLTHQITHAKLYPQNSIIPSHQRHSTLENKKIFLQNYKHNTVIGLQSQKQNNSVEKQQQTELNEKTNNISRFQQQPIQEQPQIVTLKQQTQFSPIIPEKTDTKEKKNPLRPILPKIKSKQKLPHEKKMTQKEQDRLESDVKLHVPQKNVLSETTQQNSVILLSHVMKPIKKNYCINHVFNRHRSCALSSPVTFHLPTKNDEVLYSQKISRIFCSEFKILLNKRGQEFLLGTLKSNFTGSVYNFYPHDVNDIYFSITFSSKKQGFFNEFRYSEIYINKQLYSLTGNQQSRIDSNQIVSLEDRFNLNSQQNSSSTNQILKLKSKIPTWSEQYKAFGLNFRVKQIFKSAKNTIFVDEEGKQVMKFYKNSLLTYNVSFQNPFSWILAYGYALASTDFKIVTE